MRTWHLVLIVSLLIKHAIMFAEEVNLASLSDPNPETYIQRKEITYFGSEGGQRQEIAGSRMISMCAVTFHNGIVDTDETIMATVLKWYDRGDVRSGKTNFLGAQRHYELNEGEILPFSKNGWSVDWPSVGLEYFYFPMLKNGKIAGVDGPAQILKLLTKPSFVPEFRGNWTYESRKVNGGIQIKGPYCLESTNHHFMICGVFDHLFNLHPFRFMKMSGDSMIRVRPGKAFVEGDSNQHLREKYYEKFDEIVGYYKFSMVPLESKEGKSIVIPDELLRRFKDNAE